MPLSRFLCYSERRHPSNPYPSGRNMQTFNSILLETVTAFDHHQTVAAFDSHQTVATVGQQAPVNIPIGTPIAFLFIAAALEFLPTILGSSSQTILGTIEHNFQQLGTDIFGNSIIHR